MAEKKKGKGTDTRNPDDQKARDLVTVGPLGKFQGRFFPGSVDYGTKPTDVEGPDPTAFTKMGDLVDEFGQDVVDIATGIFNTFKDKIADAATDPIGAIKKIGTAILDAGGIPEECKSMGDPWRCGEKGPDQGGKACWKDCVNFNVLGGIPGIPLPPGMIDVGTYRDFEEGLKKIGTTVGEIFEGDKSIGEAVEELKEWVLGNLPDLGSVDDTYDWLEGIFGAAMGGLIFAEIEDQLSDILFPIDKGTFDCATVNREGGIVIDEGSCEGCMDGFTPNEDGQCVEGECPPEMVKDELTGECKQSESFIPGGPCTTAEGVGGRTNEEGECIPFQAIQGDDIREVDRPETELPDFGIGLAPVDDSDDTDQGDDIAGSEREETEIDIGGFDDDDDDDDIKTIEDICAGPKPTAGFALQTYERYCEGGSFNCDSQNRVTKEDGSCGPCKPGFSFDQNFDQCVQDPEIPGVTPPPPSETPDGGGGASVGGMGAGAFAPFLAGISYTPQTLPEIQASTQPDYAQELESLITRQLAKRGMFT